MVASSRAPHSLVESLYTIIVVSQLVELQLRVKEQLN